jgi:PAS domain S-box-containing protein
MGRKVKDRLTESPRYLASIVDSSEDAIVSIDLKGVVRSWNRGAKRMLGYKAREIVGRHFYMIVPEDLRGEVEGKREEALKKGSVRFETQRLHKDGNRIPVDLTISVIKDSEGGIVGTSGVMKDISERMKLEQELAEARGHLRSIIDTIGEEICVIDRDYNIISFNRAFRRRLKFKGKIVGEKCYRVLHGYSYEDFLTFCESRCAVKKAFESGRRVRSVHSHTQEDGSKIYHESQALPSKNREGKVYQVVYIIEDVTERKRLEEELKEHAEQLELKNRELESFAYSVAHDLKAPLRAIEGFSSALLEDCGDKLDESGRHYLDRIRANSQRMDALIGDLLEYSMIGKTPQRYEEVEVSELIKPVIEDVRHRLEEKNVKLVVGEFPTVYCDGGRIAQVFANLIDNSIRFAKENPRIEIGCVEKGDFYEFYVKDNGIGFDMKYKDKIFELFYKLNPGEYGGTGVGLAIVKKIIENHRGEVWAKSEEGRGSTFYFTLPTKGLEG